jgi:Putative prokaryotic signal transducing protein
MDDLVVVDVVATQPEAELLCGLLRSAGIKCLHKLTNRGAGAADGMAVGAPRQVMVRQKDADSAREILRQQ